MNTASCIPDYTTLIKQMKSGDKHAITQAGKAIDSQSFYPNLQNPATRGNALTLLSQVGEEIKDTGNPFLFMIVCLMFRDVEFLPLILKDDDVRATTLYPLTTVDLQVENNIPVISQLLADPDFCEAMVTNDDIRKAGLDLLIKIRDLAKKGNENAIRVISHPTTQNLRIDENLQAAAKQHPKIAKVVASLGQTPDWTSPNSGPQRRRFPS